MTDIQDAIHLAAHLEHLDSESGEAKLLRRIAAALEAKDAEIEGWKLTALAMRDAAITFKETGDQRHHDAIERMYFDAAMFGRFTEMYRADEQRMPQGKE